jgi:transmembrane sensor
VTNLDWQPSRQPSAKDIERQAAAWLERREREDWSEKDRAEFETWIDASVAHRVAYVRVDSAWTRAEWLKEVHPFAPKITTGHSWFSSLFLRAAATLALLTALGAGAAHYFDQPQDREFSTPVGGHEKIAFADGTSVELNTDTSIRARMTTAGRTIWLEKGEAYFKVKHNPASPFVVIAGAHRITDLGTTFLVRRDPDQLEVALVDGRIRFGAFDGKAQAQSAMLVPGDVVTATASSMYVTKEGRSAIARDLGWRRGVLEFDKTPLVDAAREFNRYNREKLIVADPAVASITIDGTFPVNNSAAFVRVIRNVLGLRVDRRGDEDVIYR